MFIIFLDGNFITNNLTSTNCLNRPAHCIVHDLLNGVFFLVIYKESLSMYNKNTKQKLNVQCLA